MLSRKHLGYLVGGWCTVTALAPAEARETEALPVPFAERFDRPGLDAAWRVDASRGNTVEVQDGALILRARQNTYAHVERPLEADFLRASCAIRPAPAITWCTSLFLYWNAGNWCQLGIISRDGGRYYAMEMIDQKPHEYELGPCSFDGWHHVAIELGSDCIRYLSSEDGSRYRTEAVHRRPETFSAVPARLILGKGHGGPPGYPAPDLNNDYTDPGPAGTSAIRDVAVTPLAWADLRATAKERAAWEAEGLDLPGEKELAGRQDPMFESVCRYFPAMTLPREIIGVKDHPHAIGIDTRGALQLNDVCHDPKQPIAFFEIGEPAYRLGGGKEPCVRQLWNGYMPIVVLKDAHDGLELEQTAFGYTKDFSADEPLFAYVRLAIVNGTGEARKVPLRFRVQPAHDRCPPKEWSLDVPAGERRAVEIRVPFAFAETSVTDVPAAEFDTKLAEASEYWEKLLAPCSMFDIPEPRVQNAYRAWLAYNFMNVHKRDGVYHICDGSGFYMQVYGYSAALYCHMLDLYGRHEQARTYIDSLLTFQRPDGLFYINFGVTDTGTLLYVMSEHYRLTRDAEWLRKMAPKMVAMCNWIIEHRKLSMCTVHGGRALVHGLVWFRPYADYVLPAYDYFANAYLYKGMKATAGVFGEIGMKDESARLDTEASAFLKDILVSMDAAVITHDGMRMLPIMPDTQALLKETGYTANGYYGLLASCLLETGTPPYDDPRADLVVNMLRRKGGLLAGVCQFQGMIDHAYAYGYWMTCLQRDEVKRVILGLYGSLAYGMTQDTYSAVECTRIRTGENYSTLPHTYSNTQQLRLLRNMLLREDGEDLRIGQAIPRAWLADGKRVAVRQAPTEFGPTSFVMESKADAGVIDVHIDPPSHGVKGAVKLRLRHPAALEIKGVECKPQVPMTFKGKDVDLPRLARPVDLRVTY